MATFCTDAGHGGKDSGGAWHNVFEKDINLQYTLALNALLKQRGHQMLTTRKADHPAPPLATRYKLINLHHSQNTPRFDAIISLHCNVSAYKNPASGSYMANQSTRGFYTIYNRESIKGRDLASSIANQIIKAGITVKNGGKLSTLELGRTLAWIHKTLPPAVVIELGYLTNFEELTLLKDSEHQEKIITAIADGIENYVLE